MLFSTFFPRNSIIKYSCSLASFLFCFLSLSALQAQIRCPACDTDEVAGLNNVLEQHYLQDLVKSYAEAHSVTGALSAPYIGQVRINRISLGAQLNLGRREETENTYTSESGERISSLSKPTNYSAFGSLFIGLNLGGLFNWFGMADRLLHLPPVLSLDRIDVLASSADSNNTLTLEGASYSFKSNYVGIHYQIINGLTFPVLGGWKGIVLGLGYGSSEVRFREKNDDLQRIALAGGDWISSHEVFTLSSKMDSFPVELKTGLSMLFIHFSATAGVVSNTGKSILKYERSGTLRQSDGTSVGELNADLRAEVKTSDTLPYYKMGVEFPLAPFFHASFESTYASGGLYAYVLGARLDF